MKLKPFLHHVPKVHENIFHTSPKVHVDFKTFIEFGQTFLGTILYTPGDSDLGYVLEVDLIYPDNIEEKTNWFPLCPENEVTNVNEFTDYMNSEFVKASVLYAK